ncbi:hypothetical protein [Spirosoma pomorum]
MQRLLNQYPEENAVIELNNLLAESPIRSITNTTIQAIEQKYGLSLLKQFKLNLEEFYAVQLNYALTDQHLSEDELDELNHLRTLLQIPSASVEMIHARIGEVVYRRSFEEALQDGQLSAKERLFLTELQQTISLPPELAETISQEVRENYLARFIDQYGADARITPEEEMHLRMISKNLGIKPDRATKQTLDRFKLYWALENIELPLVDIAVPLQKSEHCHYQVETVQWYEERATDRRSSYTDHFVYDKVFEEIDVQSGNSTTRKERFDLLKRIDEGSLFVTNKRLIFVGVTKTSSIKLSAISNLTAYKQGIWVGKLTGKSPLLMMKRDADVVTLICRRLLRA